jgi:hypothetical protein
VHRRDRGATVRRHVAGDIGIYIGKASEPHVSEAIETSDCLLVPFLDTWKQGLDQLRRLLEVASLSPCFGSVWTGKARLALKRERCRTASLILVLSPYRSIVVGQPVRLQTQGDKAGRVHVASGGATP